jgi:hypothetical protein
MWTTLSGGVKSVQDRARQPSRVEEPAQHVLRLVDPLEIRSELGKGTLGWENDHGCGGLAGRGGTSVWGVLGDGGQLADPLLDWEVLT